MALDDDAASTNPEAPGGAGRARRRSARPWSNPASAVRPGADKARDASWTSPGAPSLATTPPIAATPRPPSTRPLGTPGVDISSLTDQLATVQSQLAALQGAVASPAGADVSLVTGPELAAAIETLGESLGGGMATLLTEHRNLLARDVSAAADRILDELGTRLRTANAQVIDGLEERIRHLVTRSVNELGEQVDLRLDKIQADVTGLRAVMLDLPDQSAVTARLDELAESISSSKGRDGGRVSPAMSAAIERSVSGPLEHLDETVHSVVDLVREILDERLPEEALASLTKEVTALKRRISLRSTVPAEEAGPADDEAPADIPVVAEGAEPTSRVTGRRGRRTIRD